MKYRHPLFCGILVVAVFGTCRPIVAWAGPSGGPPSIYDYVVSNVCVDPAGRPTAESPLSCPLAHQRDMRPDDHVSVVHSDYPISPDAKGCRALGLSRRYAFPLAVKASDETGNSYPLIVGWTDYPPHGDACDYGQFDSRDTLTLLTVTDSLASLVGAFHHKHWYLTVGSGYRNPARQGVSRFVGTWSFPATLPPLGATGWHVFPRHTMSFDNDAFSPANFPPSDPGFKLSETFQAWKHMSFVFGTRDKPTRPIDTLLHMGFARTNDTDQAPGESVGSEHIYLTRELGYATRWESWARDDNRKDVMHLARTAYAQAACSMPATVEGQVTPDLVIGPVIDDPVLKVFKQQITTRTRSGGTDTHWWYMTGCHDFTNIHQVPDYVPSHLVNAETFGQGFIDQFKSAK
ncbi:hypothetical protein [Gluconacetobacter tumulisoli]|uniref:Uncharacterized protein n=1 Tax=Gluconacetobacter tumulisoli TaxID=1286189 RepID=A0A7W4K697_9PROT|nr:hypothetical protein [Gluconacetobacter tumulisoli]MBB2201126.1 hypothetical protein [Gluconacetobacter tumulisoli]